MQLFGFELPVLLAINQFLNFFVCEICWFSHSLVLLDGFVCFDLLIFDDDIVVGIVCDREGQQKHYKRNVLLQLKGVVKCDHQNFQGDEDAKDYFKGESLDLIELNH